MVANNETLPISGIVDIELCIHDTPVRVHALYVPQLAYKLIVGTNVLLLSGVRIMSGSKRLWPVISGELHQDVRKSRVMLVVGPTSERLCVAQHRAWIPPMSATFVSTRVKNNSRELEVKGDVLIEPLKKQTQGVVSRQLQTVNDGLVNVLVTNLSWTKALDISPGMVLSRIAPCVRPWCDMSDPPMTMEEEDSMTTPSTEHVGAAPIIEASPADQDLKKTLNRRERRAISQGKIELDHLHKRMGIVNSIVEGTTSPEGLIKSVRISGELNTNERNMLLALLEKNKDIFTLDLRSTTPYVKHHIDAPGPGIKQAAYRIPHSEKETVRQYIEENLEKGIIQPSNSPWSSPILLVAKKDGSKRFCVDYRKLNAMTKKDIFPIPRVDDILDRLDNMKYFTKLDLISGYYQIEMDEESKEKTAFITEEGSFEYNVMPFGLTNAPSTFQRLMNLVLSGLNWKICLVYIDDILIFSTDFGKHLNDIQLVFNRLHNAKLKLKASKCEFAFSSTTYLGHTISNKGVSTDKVAAIAKWTPERITNISDIRKFLGLTGYYRRFIQNYSRIAAPLTDCLKKDATMIINGKFKRAFNRLKTAIISAPILVYPKWNIPFVLQCDASDVGLGSVLTQYHHNSEHPIAYYSRRFDKHEQNYPTMEKEALAIVDSIKHFRPYLYGYKFIMVTDHKPLEHMDTFRAGHGRIARWKLLLADYNFEVVAKPGKKNGNADTLSRLFLASLACRINDTTKYDRLFIKTNDPLQMRKWQLQDKITEEMITYLENKTLPNNEIIARAIVVKSELYYMNNGLLYFASYPTKNRRVNTQMRLVIPDRWKKLVIRKHHDDPLGAHQGIRRTYELIADRYYWENMFKDVDEYV